MRIKVTQSQSEIKQSPNVDAVGKSCTQTGGTARLKDDCAGNATNSTTGLHSVSQNQKMCTLLKNLMDRSTDPTWKNCHSKWWRFQQYSH